MAHTAPGAARLTWPALAAALLLALPVAVRAGTGAQPAAGGPHAGSPEATGPAAASTAPPLLTVCAEALRAPPSELDHEATEREASALQDRGDPKAMDLACQGYAHALRHLGAGDQRTVRWINSLGIGLFTRRRSDEALPVLTESFERALALGTAARPLALRAAGVISLIHLQRQQMDQALLWSQRSVDQVDPAGPPSADELRLQLNHASLLSMARRDEAARTAFAATLARAQTQAQAFGLEIMAVLHQWAIAERRSGHDERALALNTQSIAHLREHLPEQQAPLALTLHNRAVLLRGRARFDEAEQTLREALALSRGASANAGTLADLFQAQANIRDTLSSLLVSRGQVQEALVLAQEAVAMVGRGPEAGSAGNLRPWRRLAEAQSAAGDLAGALGTWRLALPVVEANAHAGDLETRLAVWLSYARTQLLLGDLAEAERAADRAEAEVAGKPSPAAERAQRLELRAAMRRAQARPADALNLLQQADQAWAEQLPAEHPARVRVAAWRCALGAGCASLAAGASAPALPADVRALRSLALADEAQRQGAPQHAEARLRAALEEAHAAADQVLQWRALLAYARLQAQAERWAEAAYFGKRALILMQRLRESAGRATAQGEEHFLRDKAETYRQVADWLLQQQRLAEALEVLRLLKRSELDDFRERAAGPERAGPTLSAQEQRWQALIDDATSAGAEPAREIQRLRELARQQRITPDEQRQLEALLAQQQAARAALRTRLDEALAQVRQAGAAAGQSAATPAALRLPRPAAGELRAWLMSPRSDSGQTELVAVLAGARRTWVERVRFAPGTPPLTARIAELMDRLQQRQSVLGPAQALYESVGRVLDGAARRERAQRVLLWLDGPLRYLPMGVLHDGRQYLGERLSFVISGRDLAAAQPAGSPLQPASTGLSTRPTRPAQHARPTDATASAPAGPAAQRLQAWGMTQASAGLPALPGVADELCGIVDGPVLGLTAAAPACADGQPPRGRGAWPGRADADRQFTEAALVDPTHRASHVHIGTHFVLRPGNIGRSWLLLGDGQALSLQRLSTLALGQPRLVTLSACETAVPGLADDGREIDGLAASWLAKGAQQVLATLWRVDDRTTARFMQRFYAALAQAHADPARALQQAQQAERQTLGPDATPHWAAFTLLERR